MSEWIVNGNRPKNPNFKGEMTDHQQELVDTWEAQDRLIQFLGDACRRCVQAQIDVINPVAHETVSGNMTKEQAVESVVNATRECTGPEVDERYYDADLICPRHEQQRTQRKGSCF